MSFYFKLPVDSLWADRGHVVAWDQYRLSPPSTSEAVVAGGDGSAPELRQTADTILIQAGRTTVAVDRKTAAVTSYKVGGHEMFASPLVFNFFKVPNDNQRAKNIWRTDWGPWIDAARRLTLTSLRAERTGHVVKVQATLGVRVGKGSMLSLDYAVQADGALEVDARYTPGTGKLYLLPRFGMATAVPRRYGQVQWYGRGPQETYWDRKTGAEIAIHQSSVDEMWFPYVHAQDTGNRTDTRWFRIVDDQNRGIAISATGDPISFSILPFTLDDLMAAKHPYELPRREFNTVFVDWKLHGVGGDNTWGAPTHTQYTLPGDRPYRLRFSIKPLIP